MKYIIEQWNDSENQWFRVGEAMTFYQAECSCLEARKLYPDIHFRILSVISVK